MLQRRILNSLLCCVPSGRRAHTIVVKYTRSLTNERYRCHESYRAKADNVTTQSHMQTGSAATRYHPYILAVDMFRYSSSS